jgi:hypothetical protein
MRRDSAMRGDLLAALVLGGLLAGPATAGAQPYSEAAAFGTLYTSFGLLQALDAHSTSRALASGAAESNTLVAGLAHRPVLLMGAKTAVTAGTIVLMERFRKRHPRAAMVTMMVMNSAYAVVVVRNSRIAHQRRVRGD